MNFLLECFGFPPDADEQTIVQQVINEGESVPWRGPEGEHYRLQIATDLELRVDREEGSEHELGEKVPSLELDRSRALARCCPALLLG